MASTKADLAVSIGSQLAYKLIGFAILAVLARYLSQDDFGRLSLAISVCTVAVLFTDLGYSTDSIRKIAQDPGSMHDRLSLVLSLRIPLLLSFFVIINALVWLSKPDLLPVTLGIALSIGLKDMYRSYAAAFVARRRIVITVISFGSGLLICLLGVISASYLGLKLSWIVAFYILGSLTTLTYAVHRFRHLYGPIPIKVSGKRFRENVFSSFMLFALTGLNYAHFALDNIAIGYLRDYDDVAIYGAAAQLYEASQFAVRPITVIMFPIFALLCMKAEWSELKGTLTRMYGASILLGIVAWIFVMLLADQIISIVFSSGFENSAQILRILYASTPGLFVTSVGVFVAASLQREKQACITVCVGLAVKLIVFPLVIPPHGPVGAAWLNLCTQSLIGCWLVLDSYRVIAQRRSYSSDD